jgi:hypothetical protein
MSDRLVWRIHWIRTYFCLIWAVFLLIGLTYFGDTPSVSTTILGSVLTAVSGVGLFRALRAGVSADSHHLMIRKFFWTRRLLWSDVIDIEVIRSAHLIPWRLLAIQTDKGLIRVPEIASLSLGRTRSKVDEIAAEIRNVWNTNAPDDQSASGL